jgi:hypothetical protein
MAPTALTVVHNAQLERSNRPTGLFLCNAKTVFSKTIENKGKNK